MYNAGIVVVNSTGANPATATTTSTTLAFNSGLFLKSIGENYYIAFRHTRLRTCFVASFHCADVVTRDCEIGSWAQTHLLPKCCDGRMLGMYKR
jgi:hypothetical protein